MPPAVLRRGFSTTVHSLLEARASRFPSKDICRFEAQDVRWSIADLRKHSRAFAGGLINQGFVPGSSVLLVLPNNLERLAFIFGAAQAQAICAVVDGTPTAEGIQRALEHSGARAVVVGRSAVAPLRKAVPELETVSADGFNDAYPVVSSRFPNLRRAWHTGYGKESKISRVRDALLYNPIPDPLEKVIPNPDAPFFAMYSSNGSVIPNSLATQAQVVSKAQKLARTNLSLSPEDRLLLSTAGNPEASIVAALACLDSCAQLIVPTDPTKTDKLCIAEGVTSSYGEVPPPKNLAKSVTVAMM